MTGTIFSIEEFSIYDGPGIRTSVFLKGCPLRCSWCHNPEGQRGQIEIVRSPNGCYHCGRCEAYAEKTEAGIRFTEESITHCPARLLRYCGKQMDASQVFAQVMKNERLLRRGGVTFSGGEPLYQGDFLLECLALFRGKLHTAVQTSGYCREAVFRQVLERSDYFLFDLKVMNPQDSMRYTGVSNEQILRNFEILTGSGTEFVVRIPLIPGITDTEENLEAIAALLLRQGVDYAELLPYNTMAGGKYALVGRRFEPLFDTKRPVNCGTEIFGTYHIRTKIL